MGIIRKLRGRFDEPYRIRNGWGLSPLRSQREVRALVNFCKGELGDEGHMKLNIARWDIYNETVRLYIADSVDFHTYVEDHVGWYWSWPQKNAPLKLLKDWRSKYETIVLPRMWRDPYINNVLLETPKTHQAETWPDLGADSIKMALG